MKSFLVDWAHFSSQKGHQRDLVGKVITAKISRMSRRRQGLALGRAPSITFKNCYPTSIGEDLKAEQQGPLVSLEVTFEYDKEPK